jgi:DNA repair protein RecO (recombination protein O)
MNQVEMVFYEKDNEKLTRFKEIKGADIYKSIPLSMKKMAIGQFIIELARNSIKERNSNEELYDFIIQTMNFLDQNDPFPILPLYFITRLTQYIGFYPQVNFSPTNQFFDLEQGIFKSTLDKKDCLTEDLSKFLFQLLSNPDIYEACKIDIPSSARKELLGKMLVFYSFHVHSFRELKSHEILHEILQA